MTRKSQVTTNAQDIGYVLGKVEMIEKQLTEQSEELKEIESKIDKLTQNLSFWKHGFWLFKALILSLPLIATANWESISTMWKDL